MGCGGIAIGGSVIVTSFNFIFRSVPTWAAGMAKVAPRSATGTSAPE
jgi:hypothetical protein